MKMKEKYFLDGLLRLSLEYMGENNFVQIIESHKTSYNDVYDSKTLYSGLLQEKFVEKICQKENGELFIPGIPDELKTCVLGHDLSSNRTQREFQFEVEDPRLQDRIVKVKAQFEATTCSLPTFFFIDPTPKLGFLALGCPSDQQHCTIAHIK